MLIISLSDAISKLFRTLTGSTAMKGVEDRVWDHARGEAPGGGSMLGYFSHAGFKVITTVQNGIMVQRPDFWVLRVSLLGLDEAG
eukprot:4309029-Prymnesium_polylepis.1